MRNVGAAQAERHRRRGRIRNLAEQGRERRIDVAQESARGVRLGRDDDLVRFERGAQAADHAPASTTSLDSVHTMLEEHRARRQARGDRRDHLLHAVLEGHEEAPARSARPCLRRPAARAPESENDGPLAPLELAEPRHRGREREIVGIGRVDPGDERLSDALERLASQSAAHEGPEALVVTGTPRQDEIEGHAQLAAPRKQTGLDERPELRRRQELEAVGQRVETPGAPDEDLSEPIVGAHEPVLDAEPPAECQRPRLLRKERIGACLDEESAGALGRDDAAEPVA